MKRDKHGLPDPLTLRVRSTAVLDALGGLAGVIQYSPCVDRSPRGVMMQWDERVPSDPDPRPADGREYAECISGFHSGSRWVPVPLMSADRSRKTGFRCYCKVCWNKITKVNRMRRR